MLTNMNTCLIISGGDFCTLPASIEYDYVIACDKGLQYANVLKIVPNLILGDFDSYEGDVPKAGPSKLLTYPVEKDDSDTMLAIKYALSNGYKHIIIICALGGRLDHTIANLQSMNYVASQNGICEIISEAEHLITFTGPEIVLPKKDQYSLSLFSVTDSCHNVSISGAGYNVNDITLNNTFPIGLSNYWKESSVKISMSDGIMLIVMSKHLDGFTKGK